MRKPITILAILILGIGIGIGGSILFSNQDKNVSSPNISVADNQSGNEQGWLPEEEPKKQSPKEQTNVNPEEPEELGDQEPENKHATEGKPAEEYMPGPIISPPPNNENDKGNLNNTDSANNSNNVTPKNNELDSTTIDLPKVNIIATPSEDNEEDSKANNSNDNSDKLREVPTETAPKDTSPPPPPPTPKETKPTNQGITFGENLQFTKAGLPAIGAPQKSTIYPIIADGTSYQGKINPSNNLSQADVSRLASYTPTAIAEWNDVFQNPIGAYATDSEFKKVIDKYIENMGPHIQRKLKTTEWEFTPAPMAAYSVENFGTMFGSYSIRGILKVLYTNPDNPLSLKPNTWYQGDVELGFQTVAFFTNNPEDRIPRTILKLLVVLDNWGKA
jgi:hypothetical protein